MEDLPWRSMVTLSSAFMSSRQERISLSVSSAAGRVEDFAMRDFAAGDFAAEAGDLRTRDNTGVDRDFPFHPGTVSLAPNLSSAECDVSHVGLRFSIRQIIGQDFDRSPEDSAALF